MDFQKFQKYFFFAFLFLLPFQTVYLLREPMIGGEKWQYGMIGLYFSDVILVLAFSCFVFSRWKFTRENQESRIKNQAEKERGLIPYSLFLILFIGWSGLSMLWASDQALAGYFFAKLLLAAGVFFLARSLDEGGVKTAIKLLLAAAVIQSVIGVGQFLTQSTFSSSLLGMSAHEAWTAGTSVLKLEEGRFLRAYGTLPHPNMLGGFLAAVLVVGISYLVSSITYGENTKYIIRNTRYRLITYHASLILILLALILTFSRSAWMGAVMGIAVYCVFRIRYHVSEKKHMESSGNIISRPWNYVTGVQRVPGVLLAVGMAAAVFVFVLRDQVFPRFDGATIATEGSVSERVVSFGDAKTLIAAHPIIGVGAGNFTKAIMENEPARPVWSIQPAHNVFALVWTELGAVGAGLFSLFLFSVIASIAWLSRNQEKSLDCHGGETPPRNDREGDLILKNQTVIFAIAFLVILPSLFLDHWLWSSHFGILFFFLLLGFVVRRD